MPRLPHDRKGKRDEALTILNWLHDKKVHTILNLHVPDSLANLVSEHDMVDTFKKFNKIESLDWCVKDMSLETVQVIPGLKKLYLYWSGNRDILKYWTGSEGVVALKEARY